MRWIVAVALVVIVGYLLVLVALSVRSRRAPALGLRDGHLTPCVHRSNCVHTEDLERGRPEPPLAVDGNPEAALDRLERAVRSLPSSRIVERRPGYLRAEFRTTWMRFVDDFEAAADPRGAVLHMRSSSRVGRADRGANRRRIRALRAEYERLAAVPGA